VTDIGDGGVGCYADEQDFELGVFYRFTSLPGCRPGNFLEARVQWHRQYGAIGCEFLVFAGRTSLFCTMANQEEQDQEARGGDMTERNCAALPPSPSKPPLPWVVETGCGTVSKYQP